MYVLLFDASVDGTKAVLGSDNSKYTEHLTCKAFYNHSEMEKCLMHRREGVSTYYIGEDVLYMFDEKLELLDLLSLLHDVAGKEMGSDNNTERLCQKLLGCNNDTVVDIRFK